MSKPLDLHADVTRLITKGGLTVLSAGDAFPADATAGYVPGALHIDTTNALLYINVGSATSSNFDAYSTI